MTARPTDSAMLALGKIFTSPIDIVVSGVNSGPNLGDDVLLSGTVGAALNGYLHGCHALAVSLEALDDRYLGHDYPPRPAARQAHRGQIPTGATSFLILTYPLARSGKSRVSG